MLTTLIITVCLNAGMTEGCTSSVNPVPMNRNRCEFTGVTEVNKLYRHGKEFASARCEDVGETSVAKR